MNTTLYNGSVTVYHLVHHGKKQVHVVKRDLDLEMSNFKLR